MRVIYCYTRNMLPHPGGLMDQPSTFVQLTMELEGYVSTYRKEQEDSMANEQQRTPPGQPARGYFD